MLSELTVQNSHYIVLPQIRDSIDGCISVVESEKNIPFKIKRVYYIYHLANRFAVRGKHAHKELEQVLFCVNGSFTLSLDDGINKQTIRIDKPNLGVYIGTNLWHTMTLFSDDCVLLVFASDYYKESDYIRNYNVFLRNIENYK